MKKKKVTELTRERMRESKLGTKFTEDHKTHMRVSQLIRNAYINGWCPITRVWEGGFGKRHRQYSQEEKIKLVKCIYERNPSCITEQGLEILQSLIKNDK